MRRHIQRKLGPAKCRFNLNKKISRHSFNSALYRLLASFGGKGTWFYDIFMSLESVDVFHEYQW